MTADVELLPLPMPNGDYTNPYDGDDLENYAHINVAHATAAKDAEIEALRAEVEMLKASCQQAADGVVVYADRAERLAEALRDLMAWQVKNVTAWHNSAYDRAARELAALNPTAAQGDEAASA